MKHTACFKTKIVTWTLLFSFFLWNWNGNGWAHLQSDETRGLMPASQGLQPAQFEDDEDDGGCGGSRSGGFFRDLFRSFSRSSGGCNGGIGGWNPPGGVVPPVVNPNPVPVTPVVNPNPVPVTPVVNPNPVSTAEKPHSYTYVYVTNASGGIDVQTYVDGVYLSTKPYSGAALAAAAEKFLPGISRRFGAEDLSSEFFLKNSFSRETVKLLSKYLLLYDSKFSAPNSFSATLIRQLSLSSFGQEPNIKDSSNGDSTRADLFKPLSFDNDVSTPGVNNNLPRVPMGPDIKSLSVIEVLTVLSDDRLKALMIREANNGRFFFGHDMIQELLQKDSYEIRSDKVYLQSGEGPSLTADSLMEIDARINLMRSFQVGPQLEMTSSTALKGGIPYMEESDPVADSLSMDDSPAVRSAADAFRVLIKKYPGLSIGDMNVKLLEGYLDLDQIGEGYTSPWNWMETWEPAPITSVLSVTG